MEKHRLIWVGVFFGAPEEIWTPKPLPVHGPEPCASANSAIPANYWLWMPKTSNASYINTFCRKKQVIFPCILNLFPFSVITSYYSLYRIATDALKYARFQDKMHPSEHKRFLPELKEQIRCHTYKHQNHRHPLWLPDSRDLLPLPKIPFRILL